MLSRPPEQSPKARTFFIDKFMINENFLTDIFLDRIDMINWINFSSA